MFHIFSSTTSRVVVSYWVWGLGEEERKFVVINISDVIYIFYSRRSRKSFGKARRMFTGSLSWAGFAFLLPVTSRNTFYNRFSPPSPKSNATHHITPPSITIFEMMNGNGSLPFPPHPVPLSDPENIHEGVGKMKNKKNLF